VNLNQIKEIYEEYLRKENSKNFIERYIGKEGYFNASWAGHCIRKHAYKMLKQEIIPPDRDSLFKMRIGTLVHDDIQKALQKYYNGKGILITEGEIEIPDLNVRGYFDIAEVYGGIQLNDLKTIAAFAWKRKFGRKENRDPNPSDKYELQLGTYGLGLELKLGKQIVYMSIIYYKKDDSSFKEVIIIPKYKEKAIEYWKNVLSYCKPDVKIDELTPGDTLGVPYESWECRYCSYMHVCPSPFISQQEVNNAR
jgi:CRISPR/Cas system-associated exonuclease Cas4 (RecB family)